MSDVGDRAAIFDFLQELFVERPTLPTRHAATLSPIMPSRKWSIAERLRTSCVKFVLAHYTVW